eukprot:CAMPEP_0172519224 /NCGR_PEP_ID=MMETSP1066-20121228/291288_1 /TAXON_ID=671091 /ORGANISM="Coscinodiscus wailesii, Strain CCMP2513" /LENGTH=192 /DNA_ID=CAMNT_0013301769 /DNA_START=683 /DNA_END=1259 /DNA_ORIENTATION=-
MRMMMNVAFPALVSNSPYERLRLDRKVGATDDGQVGNDNNNVGESKQRSRSFLQRDSDTLISYNVDGVSLEEARCVYDDDDLIYDTDDIANEDNEVHKNNSRKDVAVKSNSLAPTLKGMFQFASRGLQRARMGFNPMDVIDKADARRDLCHNICNDSDNSNTDSLTHNDLKCLSDDDNEDCLISNNACHNPD